jgi:hypothetical protein
MSSAGSPAVISQSVDGRPASFRTRYDENGGNTSPDGEIGRHSGLKIRRPETVVGVQVPLRAPRQQARHARRVEKVFVLSTMWLLYKVREARADNQRFSMD